MTRVLHIGKGLSLPGDAVTSTAVIYGGKGQGKTNLGAVICEELARAHLKFAVLDAPGVWWGLRFDVSGKGPGIEVLILGGVHGDIPIEPTGGAVVADLVADEDASVVIDISRRPDGTMWSIAERVRFVTDYCKRLYQRQGEKRRPVMQLIDEAARFIPQIVRQGEQQVAACMGAIAAMVEEGRNVGIGVTLITQRSARLNKDVAELADAMISFRTVGPNSRRAVLDWLGEYVEKGKIKELDEKLRALPRGTALVVSPGWLEFEGVVPMRARETFDSSATPKPGQAAAKVSGGAKPDLGKYAERMKETIERAAASDPRALQKRVAELQAQVKKLEAAKAPAAKTIYVEVPVLKEAHVKRLEAAVKGLATASDRAKDAAHDLQAVLIQVTWPGKAANAPQALLGKPPHAPPPQIPYSPRADPPDASKMHNLHQPQRQAPAPVNRPAVAPRAQAGDHKATGGLGAGERRMLEALARRHPVAQTRAQVGALSGFASGGGTFRNYCATLKRAGLVAEDRGALSLTDAGIAAAGSAVGAAMSPDAIREMWRRSIGAGEWRMVEALLHAHPASLTRQELGERTEFESAGGTFRNYAATIKRVGLATEDRDGLRVVEELIG